MSMLYSLRRVSVEQLDALARDPSDIFFFLHGSEPYAPKPGFLARLFGGKPAKAPPRAWQAPAEGTVLDLDKNWHILHYLFCRHAWEGPLPQASLLAGGVELGEVEVGYGPARGLRPPEVAAFLGYLETLDRDSFGADVSAREVEQNDIYWEAWRPEQARELWEYVDELKAFLKRARDENHGILLYLY